MTSPGLPEPVREGVKEALEERGKPAPSVAGVTPVGGGSINASARIDFDDGTSAFLKWNPEAPRGFFTAEADGLRAIRDAGPVRVPEVLGLGERDGEPSWLLLELVPRGGDRPDFADDLASGLVVLHRSGEGPVGWERDNFIGSLPQSNTPREEWSEFWTRERLEPQLRRARNGGWFEGEAAAWDRLLHRVPELLEAADAEGPALLHGDLWSGNVYPGPGGEPVLVDPAVYRGHREVDLAMAELFGGLPEDFFLRYRRAWPLPPGYDEVRRDLYQLYYLLVHVNLFGSSYVAGTMERVRRLTE